MQDVIEAVNRQEKPVAIAVIIQQIGVPDAQIARCRGPIGLIPQVRDPQTLAVSVLAEILTVAREAIK